MSRLLSEFSPKDRNTIKGALRRAFARSDLYLSVKQEYKIEHSDPRSPRCQNWVYCSNCGEIVKSWTTNIDHVSPVVPLDRTLEQMSICELVDRIWCDRSNLALLCTPCHDMKTKAERALRPKKSRKVKK